MSVTFILLQKFLQLTGITKLLIKKYSLRPLLFCDIFGENYPGFLVAILPPGAFIVAGFLIAFKNMIDDTNKKRKLAAQPKTIIKGAKRLRTTGAIS